MLNSLVGKFVRYFDYSQKDLRVLTYGEDVKELEGLGESREPGSPVPALFHKEEKMKRCLTGQL